jgi:hypothetical protein
VPKKDLLLVSTLTVAVVLIAACSCGGTGSGSGVNKATGGSTTPATTPSTAEPVRLTVTSTPSGATVELNPQRNDRHAFPGTGRILGTTPLSADLLASDFIDAPNGSCVSFVALVSKRGFFGSEQHFDTCLANGDTGKATPKSTYSANVKLQACPPDNPVNCGFPADGP